MTKVTTPSSASEPECGRWAFQKDCPGCGQSFARQLLCGCEWCPECGKKWSPVHRQRFVRWLPKAQTVKQMGYLTVTVTPELREDFRCIDRVRKFRRGVTRALKRLGFERGLTRWHWFGEQPGIFHPHLNILVPRGYLPRPELTEVKRAVARQLGIPDYRSVVVHYQFTRNPGKMVHMLKYLTRATFRKYDWAPSFANQLHGFNNCHNWGVWKELPKQWELEREEKVLVARDMFGFGLCPCCGDKLAKTGILPVDRMRARGWFWNRDCFHWSQGRALPDAKQTG